MDVRQMYGEAQSELRAREAEMAALKQTVDGLRKIVDGLLAIAPHLRAETANVTATTETAAVGARVVESVLRDVGHMRMSELRSYVPTNETREQIKAILAAANSFLSTQEIVEAMVHAGHMPDDKQAAVSLGKVVSRMAGNGTLARAPRDKRSFIYGLPSMAVQNAESPALTTGLSVVPDPDSPEGGEANGTGDHRDHDLREDGRDHSGGGAPAVVGGAFL